MLLKILLVSILCCVVQSLNIEVRESYPIYLRNGGSNRTYQPSLEPAFAGYTFSATIKDENISILVGQPRDGIVDSNSSTGAMYYCNVSFQEVAATGSGVGSGAGSGVSVKTVSTCKEEQIFDPLDKTQTGDFHQFNSDAIGLNLGTVDEAGTYAVCAQGRQKECPGENILSSNPGACYYGNPVTDSWTFLRRDESKCFDAEVDIIFLVDGSKSIGTSNFNLVKRWLIEVIKSLTQTYGDAVRTEVLQYSNKDPAYKRIPVQESEMFEIPYTLKDSLPIKEIERRIQDMKYLNSATYTYFGMERAQWEFRQSPRYLDSERVLIVITDGEATDSSKINRAWWNQYPAKGSYIPFAVGVGNYAGFMSQLKMIANGGVSNDLRILTVSSYADLSLIFTQMINSIATTVISEGQSSFSNSAANSTNNCQMGSSVTSLQDGSLHIGAVGMYLDSGSVMRFNSTSDTIPEVPTYAALERALPERTSDSYLGFTAVSGFFNGISQGQYIAAGAPRYKLKGAVVVYKPGNGSDYMENSVTILPPNDARDQVAGYFGGCLLSVDVSGDGVDDLFIASPLFVGEKNDEGRVSVYIGSRNHSITEWIKRSYIPVNLHGDKSDRARFGSAMAAAGDLNLDGFHDVIIGAPMSNDGRGAVFIYHGRDGGITSEYSQKIEASSLNGYSLQYFGQSLQGNIDIDKNGYPDILVGAPKSDSIVIFKSRPVVRITSTLEFSSPTIDILPCLRNLYKNCASLRVCFLANGTFLQDAAIGITYNLTLEPKLSIESRAVFNVSSSNTVFAKSQLSIRLSHCIDYDVDLKSTASDFKTPLEAEVNFALSPDDTPMSPVLDSTVEKASLTTIGWKKSCVGDICVPDLSITGTFQIPTFNDMTSTLVISPSTEGKPVTMRLNFTNEGEISFDTIVTMTYPSKVSLSSAKTIASSPSSENCIEELGSPSNAGGVTKQTFKYINDLNAMLPNSWCQFELTALTDILRLESSLESFNVTFSVSSDSVTSVENATTTNDNRLAKSIPILYESDYAVRSEIGDKQIKFNYTDPIDYNITSVQEIGTNTSDVEVAIKVIANGYSNIPSSVITFTYPWLIDNAFPLLYLYKLDCSRLENKALCTCDTSLVNRYNLSLDWSDQNLKNNSGVCVRVMSTGSGSGSGDASDNGTLNDCEEGSHRFTWPNTVFSGGDKICPWVEDSQSYSCEVITCTISNLFSDEIQFKASFRLWTDSINNIYKSNISSFGIKSLFRISSENSMLVVGPDGSKLAKEQEVLLKVDKYVEQIITVTTVSIWIYVLAIAGGVIGASIIFVVAWKMGYFKRDRPPTESTTHDEDQVTMEDELETGGIVVGTDANGQAGVITSIDVTADRIKTEAGTATATVTENNSDFINTDTGTAIDTENSVDLSVNVAHGKTEILSDTIVEDPDYDDPPEEDDFPPLIV